MKTFDKVQYNKLCAYFLGWKHHEGSLYYTTDLWGGNGFYEFQLRFDKDWNWIMEVVDKIQSHKTLIISVNHCEIHFTPNDGVRINIGCRTTKEAVVKAIWEFLNWYNEQNKK